MSTPPDSRVDELRQQLRSLGYLNAGVDRFVLAPARDTRGPAAIALFASARIGLLGALLLGPAAAIGLSGRLPGLVTGPRDALVVALYLGFLFGFAVALLALLACLLVAWMARARPDAPRRAPRLAVGAGAVATAASLAYLTLWWRTADTGLGASAPIWTGFALAVAAAISVLLGHAITVAALAVSAAGREDRAALPRVPGASWKTTFAAAALAFAGAVVLLLATARAEGQEAATPPPLTVRPTGARITVIAIDGFDVEFHERLRPGPGASAPPGLFTAFDAARATLASSESRDPARLWTTIATGRRPDVHGVEALETRQVAGLSGRMSAGTLGRLLGGVSDVLRLTRPATASDFERRVKTFWEVAAGAGLRTAVVNWWATWPAPQDAGIVISDRAILRLDRGGALDAEIAPSDVYDRLRARWPELQEQARLRTNVFASMKPPYHEPVSPEIDAVLRRSGEIDATVMSLATAVESDLDLLVAYLPGLDIVQHTLLGGNERTAAAALEERLAALRRYYTFLNTLVSSTIGRARGDRQVFVITQPGRLHDGPGVLAAIGATSPSGTATSGTILDAAPTILHALGVPISRELDGRVLDRLFTPGFLASHRVRQVETYGLRTASPGPRTGRPLDQETIDRLRSLGYVR